MLLGQHAFKVTPTQVWTKSLSFYKRLGYQVISHQLTQGYSLLSNGQVNIALTNDKVAVASFIYHTNNLDQTVAYLQEKNILFTPKNESEILVQVTENTTILISNKPYYDIQTVVNKSTTLGNFFAHSIITKDLAVDLKKWKALGFSVEFSCTCPYKWYLLSDGKLKVDLHETDLWKGELMTYTGKDIQDKIWKLGQRGFSLIPQTMYWNNGRSSMSELQTPDNQNVLLARNIMFFRLYKNIDELAA